MISVCVANWLFDTSQLAMIALGITLATRATGYFSLVVAGAALVCPFVARPLIGAGVPVPGGFLLALGIAGLLAWFGCSVLHRIAAQSDRITPLAQLLLSLGAYYIIQSICAMLFGDDLKTLPKVVGGRVFWFILAVSSFVMSAGVVGATAWGREWRALFSNRYLCTILGIPVRARETQAFVWGSILCALGAVAYAVDTGYHPGFELPIFFRGITVAIIAGLGGPWGVVAAAAFLAGIQQATVYSIGAQWADAITFMILIGFLICKPLGFSARRLRKVEI